MTVTELVEVVQVSTMTVKEESGTFIIVRKVLPVQYFISQKSTRQFYLTEDLPVMIFDLSQRPAASITSCCWQLNEFERVARRPLLCLVTYATSS